MTSELTLLVLRLGFLLLLWLFVFAIVYALRSDLFGQRVRKLPATDAVASPSAASAPAVSPQAAAYAARPPVTPTPAASAPMAPLLASAAIAEPIAPAMGGAFAREPATAQTAHRLIITSRSEERRVGKECPV